MAKLTWEEFIEAVERLKMAQVPVTTLNIRTEIGRGSYSTIQKFIQKLASDEPDAGIGQPFRTREPLRSPLPEIKKKEEWEGKVPEWFQQVTQTFAREVSFAAYTWVQQEVDSVVMTQALEVNDAEDRVQELEASVKEFQTQLERMAGDCDVLQGENQRLKVHNFDLQQEKEDVQRQLLLAQTRANEEERKSIEAQTKAAQSSSLVLSLERALEAERSEKESLSLKVEKLQREYAEVVARLDEVKGQSQTTGGRIEALEKRNQQLLEQLARERTAMATAQAQALREKSRAEELQSRIRRG
ncbi:MAG: hypothetical protein HY774_24185 [Acidobacteria bacterium]|nr:hypothetical protein [Acidobacteriota bacterium]